MRGAFVGQTARMSHRFVDLSHVVRDGLVTYPGLPAPVVFDHLAREHAEEVYGPGNTFQIGMVTICANTGTYLDVPFHRYADGHDLCGLALERVSNVPAVVIDVEGTKAVGPEWLDGLELASRAVLFRTGHSRHWDTAAYFEGHPALTGEAAERLVEAEVACVGIDSLNIDSTSGAGSSGSLDPARCRHPDHRAPHGAGRVAGRRVHVHGGPAEDRGHGHLHRTGARHRAGLNQVFMNT